MNSCTVDLIPVLKDNYVFVLRDNLNEKTAVIDPSVSQPVLEFLKSRDWRLDCIWNTHHHADHTGGNLDLKAATGCKIIASEHDSHRIPGWDILVKSDDFFYFSDIRVLSKHIPGHTLGHIAFYLEQEKFLFCGDTLFSLGCGKLFEGTAGQMWKSLEWVKSLPTSTQIYCNHEYTLNNGRFARSIENDNPALDQRILEIKELRRQKKSTIPVSLALELATNPFLRLDAPSVKSFLHLTNATEIERFACLRHLKDQFSPTTFDLKYLVDRHDGDRELVDELLNLFTSSSNDLLEQMQNALTKGDLKGLAMYAHSLKGAAANFAKTLCTQCAADLEKAAERSSPADLQQLLLLLKVETRDLIYSAREELS